MRPSTLPHRGDVFRHFKGGHYLVLEVAHDVDADTQHVIYTPLYDEHRGKVVTRRLTEWLEPKDGEPRFVRINARGLPCCGGTWLSRAVDRLQVLTAHSLDGACILTKDPARV